MRKLVAISVLAEGRGGTVSSNKTVGTAKGWGENDGSRGSDRIVSITIIKFYDFVCFV